MPRKCPTCSVAICSQDDRGLFTQGSSRHRATVRTKLELRGIGVKCGLPGVYADNLTVVTWSVLDVGDCPPNELILAEGKRRQRLAQFSQATRHKVARCP